MVRWLFLVLAIGGCTLEEGHSPVARIEARPRIMPEHDAFQTLVELDGTRSADPIDDPDGTRPLGFRWEIVGDEVRWEDQGGDREPVPKVRFLGDRPATVWLTVTDEDGFSSRARLQMQLTVEPTM